MKPHPAKLADLNPWEPGITWKQWKVWQARLEQDAKLPQDTSEAPLNKQRVAGPRDNYGWRSAR
jgi:hypothetical protein